MDVVGHQHIGMNAAARLARVLGQPVQVDAVIVLGKETSLAVVAALYQVQRDARQGKAGVTRNGERAGRAGRKNRI